jgi:transposase
LHFTPKHASWLNQIECYFSVLQRRVVTRGSFASTKDLARAIERYMVWHNDHAKPFRRS